MVVGELVGTTSPNGALHANTYLFHLPAVGVFPKFVDKSATVDSFQDLPLVVIPDGEAEGQFKRLYRVQCPILTAEHWWCEHRVR